MIAARIGSALRRTGRIAVEKPRLAVWTLIAVACALFVFGAAGLAAEHVERATARGTPSGGCSMVVYLGEGVDETRARGLASELTKLPGVERAELVPATESAERLQQALGVDAALLDGVDLASLPASVEVTLAPGVRDVIAMSPTLRALRGTPGVDDVVLGNAGEDNVRAVPGGVRAIAWTGAGLLAVLAMVVVLVALRMRLERDCRERAVLQLLGAAPAFSLVPTALAGALQGAVAAVLAALALCGAVALYGGSIEHAFATALGSLDHYALAVPALSTVALFVALGAGLGLVGGSLAGASR